MPFTLPRAQSVTQHDWHFGDWEVFGHDPRRAVQSGGHRTGGPMIAPTPRTIGTSELTIFARLLEGEKAILSPELARYVLTLGFGEADQARMGDLAERNQEGKLSEEEKRELDGYVKAGHLLALLHSKARKALAPRKKVS